MTTPTHAPTPAEIRTIDDPTERFHAARAAEPLMKRELSDIARDVVTALVKGGMPRPAVATMLGISRQRVEQLIDPQVLAETRVARLDERGEKLAAEVKQVRAARRKVAATIEGA